jgi:hypothetical protein
MAFAQWVRLQVPARCGLRWGAWYRVTALTPREAHVWVSGHALTVSRSLLELRTTPPRDWTVVCPSRDGGGDMPRALASYLVCPGCRFRAPLPDTQVRMTRCPRCNELFTIAWDENYGAPATHGVQPDRRMTRRRLSASRRNGHERRSVEPAERRTDERRSGLHRRNAWDRRGPGERRGEAEPRERGAGSGTLR